MNTPIAAAEFKRRFSDFIGRVVFKHERFVITRRGRPVAQISPVEEMPERIGEAKGWLADSDPFFEIMDSIVADRKKHTPRASHSPK